MTKEEMKKIKPLDLSGLKSIGESLKKMSAGAFVTPKIENFVDPKTEMMAHIEQNTDKMRENSKNPFWKSLLITVIGGIISGLILTYWYLILDKISNLVQLLI